jgi:hypothetical protein
MKNPPRNFFRLLLLGPLVAVVLGAQAKPDFSGNWVLQDPPQPGLEMPRTLAIRQPVVQTTVLGGPMPLSFLDLTVERNFDNEVRAETYHIGTEGGTVFGNGTANRVSVRWENDRLHIETGRYSGPNRDSGPYIEHSEVWWLDERGRLLITVVDRRSESEIATRTLTYRRNRTTLRPRRWNGATPNVAFLWRGDG